MNKKSAILMIVTVLVVSMSFSIIAYGGDDGRETPILPLTGNSTSGDSSSVHPGHEDRIPNDDDTSTSNNSTTGGTGGWEMTEFSLVINIKDCTVANITNRAYTGKNITPAPVIKNNGQTLKKGTDYTLSYKNNKNVGVATVTITGINNYKGSVKKTFKIVPKGTSLVKLTTPKSKQLKVTWKKQTTQTTGYQIQYSTSSKFTAKTTKTATVKSNKTTAKTFSKLKGKKRYYVRIRTYKAVGKTNYYSSWSVVKSIVVKK